MSLLGCFFSRRGVRKSCHHILTRPLQTDSWPVRNCCSELLWSMTYGLDWIWTIDFLNNEWTDVKSKRNESTHTAIPERTWNTLCLQGIDIVLVRTRLSICVSWKLLCCWFRYDCFAYVDSNSVLRMFRSWFRKRMSYRSERTSISDHFAHARARI